MSNQLKHNWIQQTGCVDEDKLSFDSLVYVVNFTFIYFFNKSADLKLHNRFDGVFSCFDGAGLFSCLVLFSFVLEF